MLLFCSHNSELSCYNKLRGQLLQIYHHISGRAQGSPHTGLFGRTVVQSLGKTQSHSIHMLSQYNMSYTVLLAEPGSSSKSQDRRIICDNNYHPVGMNRRLTCEVFKISSRLSRNQKLLDVQCSPSITRLRRLLAMHTSTVHNFSDTIYAVSSGSLLFFVQQSYVMNSDSDLVLQTRDVLLAVICM